MPKGDDDIDWDHHWESVENNVTYYDDVKVFDYFIKYIPQFDFKICELGCGPARWAPVWGKIYGKYYGIDSSPKAIDRATKKFPNNKFICNPAWHLYEFNEAFDVVFTNTFLQHVKNENKDLIVRNVRNCLRPYGLFITQEKSDVDSKTTMVAPKWIKFVSDRGFECVTYQENKGFVFRRLS